MDGPTPEKYAANIQVRPWIHYRTARTVRRWMSGDSPIPRNVAEYLTRLFSEARNA